MYAYVLAILVQILIVGATLRPAFADDDVAQFYKGKTIYMVIGSAPGGGFDVYGRLVARYLGKYVPGNPAVVPQNLDGGGGTVAGTRVSVTAPQDGTFIGAIHAETILDPLIGDPHKNTKALKFAYLGSADADIEGCFVRTDAPVKSFQDAFSTELLLGGGNEASSTREFASVLKNVLGLKIKIVAGYSGNAQLILAMDRGEIQGICGASVTAVMAIRPDWFEQKKVRLLAQEGPEDRPELRALGAPQTLDFAKTEEQRQILELFYSQEEFGRPFVMGSEVPKARIDAVRSAFMSALSDPDLLREAKTMGLEISPLSGPKLGELVAKVYANSPDILGKTREAIGYQ